MLDSSALKWQFWLLWVLASALGGAVLGAGARAAAYSVGYAVSTAGGTVLPLAAVGVVAIGGLMGAIGFAQWLVMLRQVSWAGWWMLASAVSGATAGAVTLGLVAALPAIAGEAIAAIIAVGTGLAVFGVTQWMVLRRRVPWAGRLALGCVAGLVAAGTLGGVIGSLIGGETATAAGFGAGYGAITGAAVVIFSSRSATATPEAQRSTT